MITRSKIDTTKFFLAVLISFITIQIAIYVLSELGFMPMLKMGWILFLFAIIIIFTALFTLSKRIGELSMKKDGIFILIILLIIVSLFVFLPDYIPEIFSSYSLEISETIREGVGSVISATGGGIGN